MARKVVVRRGDEFFDLIEKAAPSEFNLQEIVKMNPQLIPAEDLGLDGDLLVVGRETSLASGSIDLLCLARSGDLVLVEFKTGPQNPDFRHALAQVVDYGSDLWQLSYEDFDRGVVQRHLAKNPDLKAADLEGVVQLAGWNISEDEMHTLREHLVDALATGDFIFVVAAQRVTSSMVRSLEYLNATMQRGRFFLLEVIHLLGRELTAYVAQVVAGPSLRQGGKSGVLSQTNEANFLSGILDIEYREALADVFAACTTLGIAVAWGSKGVSLRIGTPDRTEPLSVGWAFQPGGQWRGARHLTLGVQPTSLVQTPSVRDAVEGYIQAVSTIRGSSRAQGTLDAYILAPDVVPVAKRDILRALEVLVENVQLNASEHL